MVRSPGRINLIGEHIDYNGGFVFPAAIDKEIHFAAAKNDLSLFRFFALDLDEAFEISVDHVKKTNTLWANYLLGVIDQFQKRGHDVSGVDCVFGGNIPIGAGLSSSAAIENGFGFCLNELFDFKVEKIELIDISQQAEHLFAGVKCGIMDQFASMYGKKGHAIKLDCNTLQFEYSPLELSDYTIMLCDTNIKHELASSQYNIRRSECEEGLSILKQSIANINTLCDVSIELLQQHQNSLSPQIYKRCHYVISENHRVQQAFKCLNQGETRAFGALLNQSHAGLRDEYEVSCEELDVLQSYAESTTSVIGSRMMGGGFGGCTINIVSKEHVILFRKNIKSFYKQNTGIDLDIYEVNIVDGTSILP